MNSRSLRRCAKADFARLLKEAKLARELLYEEHGEKIGSGRFKDLDAAIASVERHRDPAKVRAKLWIYWKGSPVKLTLLPGQSLSWATRKRTDEGWHAEGETITFPKDGLYIVSEWWNDGRDCDGRMSNDGTSICPLMDLRAREPVNEKDESIRLPLWQCVKSGRRDYSAEAAGY